MRTSQAERAAPAASAPPRHDARHALTAWETDGGTSPEPAASAPDGGEDDRIMQAAVWANAANEAPSIS